MKKILFFLVLFSNSLLAQNNGLTLEYCYSQAITNFPLAKQKELLPSASELRIKNLSTAFYPQVNINGLASYQSAVTEIPLNIPNMPLPEMNKDMYKLTLDLTQTIYDGGATGKQKKLEDISLQVDQQSIEVELFKLKERVNALYFGVIIFQENAKLLMLLKDDISAKLTKIEAGVKNGIALSSNADVMKAEIIKIEQQLIEVDLNRKSSLNMLSELIGSPVPESTVLSLPMVTIPAGDSTTLRPETQLFELQTSRIDALKNIVSVKTMPRLTGFAQLGYGRPGLNMLSNEFDSFYMVGAKLTWNPWNWNQNKNEKQICEIQKSIISTQKDVFDKNLKILLDKELSDIKKNEALLVKDNEIVEIRARIVKTASSQLENGIITSTEYITEVNNEAVAKLNLETHKVQLVKAKINYLYLLGK